MWLVGFKLWAPNKRGSPANATTELRVCDEHKEVTKLADIITDEGWEQIVKGFESVGKIKPERKLTELVLIHRNEFN